MLFPQGRPSRKRARRGRRNPRAMGLTSLYRWKTPRSLVGQSAFPGLPMRKERQVTAEFVNLGDQRLKNLAGLSLSSRSVRRQQTLLPRRRRLTLLRLPPSPRLSVCRVPFHPISDDRDRTIRLLVTECFTTDLSRILPDALSSGATRLSLTGQRAIAAPDSANLGVRHSMKGVGNVAKAVSASTRSSYTRNRGSCLGGTVRQTRGRTFLQAGLITRGSTQCWASSCRGGRPAGAGAPKRPRGRIPSISPCEVAP